MTDNCTARLSSAWITCCARHWTSLSCFDQRRPLAPWSCYLSSTPASRDSFLQGTPARLRKGIKKQNATRGRRKKLDDHDRESSPSISRLDSAFLNKSLTWFNQFVLFENEATAMPLQMRYLSISTETRHLNLFFGSSTEKSSTPSISKNLLQGW